MDQEMNPKQTQQLLSDVELIKKSLYEIERHLEKLNGSVAENVRAIAGNGLKLAVLEERAVQQKLYADYVNNRQEKRVDDLWERLLKLSTGASGPVILMYLIGQQVGWF